MKVGDLVRYDFEDLGYGVITSEHKLGGYWVYFFKMDDFYPFDERHWDESEPFEKLEVISECR